MIVGYQKTRKQKLVEKQNRYSKKLKRIESRNKQYERKRTVCEAGFNKLMRLISRLDDVKATS